MRLWRRERQEAVAEAEAAAQENADLYEDQKEDSAVAPKVPAQNLLCVMSHIFRSDRNWMFRLQLWTPLCVFRSQAA